MADRERQRIGGVFGFWNFRQAKKRGDHALHLVFARAAIAYDGEFCFRRRVFGHFNSSPCSRQKNHSFSHAQFEGALRIFQDKLRLDSDRRRRKFLDQELDAFENDPIALLQGERGGRSDAPKIEEFQGRAIEANQSIASNARAGVNAENDHI